MYQDLVQPLLSRRHVFLHSVATHCADGYIDVVRRELPATLNVGLIDCASLPTDEHGDLRTDRLQTSVDVCIVTNLDTLLTLRRGSVLLRQLRSPVMAVAETGGFVLVDSRRRQRDFPQIDGSNLAHDAVPVRLSRVAESDLRSSLDSLGVDAASQTKIVRAAKGFRGVALRILAMARFDLAAPAPCHVPTRPECHALLTATVGGALSDLGGEAVSALSRTLPIFGRRFPASAMADVLLAELKAAGLVEMDYGTDTMILLPTLTNVECRAVVEAADLATTLSDGWTSVSTTLFTLERIVRAVVSAQVPPHPVNRSDWSTELGSEHPLDRYGTTIVGNFAQEFGLREVDVTQWPLQALTYLNFTQLLDLAQDLCTDRRVGGLTRAQWRNMADDLVPVRNRVFHGRLPLGGDRESVTRWLAVLNRQPIA